MNLDNIIKQPLPNERVVIIIHRHWIVMIGHLIWFLLLSLVPLFLVLFAGLVGLRFAIGSPELAILKLVTLAYYGLLWTGLFHAWLDYSLDIWVITNKRVIDVEQQGLWDRVVAENRLDKIQDVTSEVHGILQTTLDYGTVKVQTAGESENFIFETVGQPRQMVEKLLTFQN